MRYFCTYFDQHYVPKALALYQSLKEQCPEFKLWALCMDQVAYDLLAQLDLPEVHPIALVDFEQNDALLQSAKHNRSTIEYYFTCTPSLPLYILNHWPEVDLITYLDADLYLFSSPQPLYDEMENGSIGIIGHRFPPEKKEAETHGIYNVGWLMFRRDDNGYACLQWWREQCIEWCYDRLEGDRYADQKYLDQWPVRFQGVVVLEHKGANLAPWNVAGYRLSYQAETNSLFVDEQPLIFFHFHGLKRMQSWLYDPSWRRYGVVSTRVLRRKIYAAYIAVLQDAYKRVAPLSATDSPVGGIRNGAQKLAARHWIRRMAATTRYKVHIGVQILFGRYYILSIKGYTV